MKNALITCQENTNQSDKEITSVVHLHMHNIHLQAKQTETYAGMGIEEKIPQTPLMEM